MWQGLDGTNLISFYVVAMLVVPKDTSTVRGAGGLEKWRIRSEGWVRGPRSSKKGSCQEPESCQDRDPDKDTVGRRISVPGIGPEW